MSEPMASSSSAPQSTHVPSVESTSFATPTATTRAFVQAREERRCWLCGTDEPLILEVAHHISAARIERFQYFLSMGVIPPLITHLAHSSNLICLCTVCHLAYDCDHPFWCMIPTEATLDRYIQHEKVDYDRRCRTARRGISQARSLPVFAVGQVNYHPFITQPTWAGLQRLRPSQWPKVWKGEPTVAILKAVGAVLQPCRSEVITTGASEQLQMGIPDSICRKLCELRALWSRADPVVSARRERRGVRGRKRERGDEGGELGTGRPAKRGPGARPAAALREQTIEPVPRRSGRDQETTHRITHQCEAQNNEGVAGPFEFGPNWTANDIIGIILPKHENKPH